MVWDKIAPSRLISSYSEQWIFYVIRNQKQYKVLLLCWGLKCVYMHPGMTLAFGSQSSLLLQHLWLRWRRSRHSFAYCSSCSLGCLWVWNQGDCCHEACQRAIKMYCLYNETAGSRIGPSGLLWGWKLVLGPCLKNVWRIKQSLQQLFSSLLLCLKHFPDPFCT